VNHLEASKTVASIGITNTATNATFSHVIDTLGYDYAAIDVVFRSSTASTEAVALALAVQQSDTNADTAYSNITPFVGGGAGGFTVPTTSSSTDANVARFNIDLRGKSRYLRVRATPNTASIVCSNVRLGRGEAGADGAARTGVAVVVSG
jgi:hypothetical protein